MPAAIEDVPYRYVGSEKAGGRLGQLFYCLSLIKAIKSLQFDVWLESLTPPLSLMQLPRFTAQPVVFWVQIWVGQAMWRRYHIPVQIYERLALKSYNWGIVTSKYLREQFVRLNSKAQICVIPNGVRSQWLSQSLTASPEHFLFVGRIEPVQKGLDVLLGAVRLIKNQLKFPVKIVGRGDSKGTSWLQKQIRRLGLEHHVEWIPGASEEELSVLYSKAVALLLPSRYEASPLVIPEAFAFGIPVILSAIPELQEYPDEACLKVKPNSSYALATAMENLSRDQSRRLKMSLAARSYARQFDWNLLAEQLENFIEQVVTPPFRSTNQRLAP